ncbi:MAG TPA: magnesium transporter [Planctomycetota bacterium]|nr:magnesium transporter [Planctomycetota bacterium]
MPQQERKSLLAPELRELLEEGRSRELQDVLADLHPHDAAEQLAGLSIEEITRIIALLDLDLSKNVFSYLPSDIQEGIVLGGGRDVVKALLAALSSDDRAEFIDHLDERVRDQVFPLLSRVAREDLVHREQFEPNQVGAFMSTEYCVLDQHLRVPEAIESVRRQAPSRETIYYSYVVDAAGRLIGFLSLRDLLMARSHQTVGEIMKQTAVVSVRVDADQGEAARLIREYDLLALPVVDADGKLVGLVTHDDAADIGQEEHTEEVEKMVGVTGETEAEGYLQESVLSQLRRRSPLILLLGCFWYFTASVIHGFESALQARPGVLLALLPMVMATGGMVGTQASSLIIRSLAVGTLAPRALARVLWKELRVSGGIALALATVAFCQALLLGEAPTAAALDVAGVVALAMVVHVLSAALLGASVPMVVKAIGGDPALFSVPAVTAIADLSGAAIYLTLALLLLS